MNTKARRITTLAMLCALAYVMTAVGRIPVVLFLKYDPKDAVIALAGMIWGLACMAVGCRAALRLNWPQTLLGFVPVCLVMAPMFLQLLSAVQA